MEQWKTYKLGELCNIHRGSSPRPIQKYLSSKGQPWVKISDATADSSRYISKTKECIIPEGIKHSVVVTPGTLIVSNSATPGLPKIMNITACVHDGWLIIDNIKPFVLKEFLYYSFILIRRELSNQANGSVFQNLKTEIVKNFEIKVPPLTIQHKIVNILEGIEDKIDTNNSINDNLEQQAQALYKSWFIDFEPFCEEEFIESSLGSIPTGWKVGELNDVCEIVGGGTPSKNHPEYYCERGIAWLTPKDLSVSKSKFSSRGSEDITPEGYKNSSTKLMPRGTVLFSSRAPIGYISIATNEICTNQGFKSAVPGIAGTGYLYYFLKANTDKIESKASGSTFKEASGALMKSLEIIIPADGILNQFEAELAPILNKQENIASEIQALTTLRDTLLPKLMSGELKINEIDC